MVRVLLEMQVRAGDEARFEAAWHDVARLAATAPGNLRQALLRDVQDATRFVITTDWESLGAFRAFERHPDQEVVTAALRALRTSARMSVLEVRSTFEGSRKLVK